VDACCHETSPGAVSISRFLGFHQAAGSGAQQVKRQHHGVVGLQARLVTW
jgi:hypothetical protein